MWLNMDLPHDRRICKMMQMSFERVYGPVSVYMLVVWQGPMEEFCAEWKYPV